MKKLIIGVTLALSFSAFADITKNCKNQMDDLIQDHKNFESKVPSMLSNEDLTPEDVQDLQEGQKDVVEMAALSCSIMRKVQLQRSFLGRFGLVSQERANSEGKISHDEAIQYYEKNI